MKKLFVLTVAVFMFIPAKVGAECVLCQDETGIRQVEPSEIVENGDFLSTSAHITMADGKEFIIPVTLDKSTLTATLELASGKTVIVKPWDIEVIQEEGYQEYDDIENSTDFIQAYSSYECYLFIILCVTTGLSGIGLVFCYLAYLSC